MTTDLLPPNRSVFEEGLVDALTDALPVPYQQILDPQTAPAEWKPFLAVNEIVDLWYSDWPEARKRQMIEQSIDLARLKGTRAGVVAYLGYVEGTLIDTIAYPANFVFGRAVLGRTPIGHPPFLARYLVKIETTKPPRAFVFGRAVLGRSPIKTHSRERLHRGRRAMTVAKTPETEYRVDFAHKRKIRIGDSVPLDGTYQIDSYVSRTRL